MSFLFPAFLLALFALLIPLLIHLFNLRKYKKIYFPHTRFLQSIALQSRRQSEVQQKLLLALRMLFLLFLVLAFAQPFLSGNKPTDGSALHVVYVDNSYSMSVQDGATDLLTQAKRTAKAYLDALPNDAAILLATNDAPTQYQSVRKEQALAMLSDVELTGNARNVQQVLNQAQALMQNEQMDRATLVYISDFQKSNALPQQWPLQSKISMTGVQVKPKKTDNLYIDTAWLADAAVTTNNKIIVRTKALLPIPKDLPNLQLSINGQIKSATSLAFNDAGISTDTLSFSVDDGGWQKIMLHLQDRALRFDDTFRLAARLSPQLSILHLVASNANPYIIAALHADPNVNVQQRPLSALSNDWGNHNLVVVDGATSLSRAQGAALASALREGISVALFPARNANYQAFNEGLAALGDIAITGFDTASQVVAGLQEGHELVQGIFDHIPRQVQLPTVHWHYKIASGFQANKQAVMGFRSGDPFLAQYNVQGGNLYLLSSAATTEAGNFAGSYFFVPFLNRMAMLSKGANSYALTAGRNQSVVLPLKADAERNVVHLFAFGRDFIPPQRASGNGVAIYTDAVVAQSGFYTLQAAGNDSALIAINPDTRESLLQYHNISELQQQQEGNAQFVSQEQFLAKPVAKAGSNFPFWKVCVLLALLLLAAECWLLWRNLINKKGLAAA